MAGKDCSQSGKGSPPREKRQLQALQNNTPTVNSNQELSPLLYDANQISPEGSAAISDIRKLLETEIDQLPNGFRDVFVLRMVEQMSVDETATTLDIPINTVKTRLLRAKALLKKGLENKINASSLTVFPFGGTRCANTTAIVLARLRGQSNFTDINSHH